MLTPFNNLYDKLKRITSSNIYIPEVDGFRFIAISWVVLYHTYLYIAEQSTAVLPSYTTRNTVIDLFLKTGGKGVLIFFVISGFILALPFAKQYMIGGEKVSLSKYYLRRLTRLEPPYFISLVIIFILLALFSTIALKDLVWGFGTSLFYIHNFFPNTYWLNNVTWSLEIEIQFYLIAPLLFLIFKLSPKIRRIALLASITVWLIVLYRFDLMFEIIYRYLPYFLIGMLIADLYLNNIKIISNRFFDFILPIIAFTLVIFIDAKSFKALFLISLFLFFYTSLNSNFWKNFLSSKWLTAIGGMCYSIYLWHSFIMTMLIRHITNVFLIPEHYWLNMIIQFSILLPIELLPAIVFYVLVERPCMDKNWPHNLLIWFK